MSNKRLEYLYSAINDGSINSSEYAREISILVWEHYRSTGTFYVNRSYKSRLERENDEKKRLRKVDRRPDIGHSKDRRHLKSLSRILIRKL